MYWQPIDKAPFDQDLEIGVIEAGEVYALAFPCRRAGGGWANGLTRESVPVRPSHWRYWQGVKGVPNGQTAEVRDRAFRRTTSRA